MQHTQKIETSPFVDFDGFDFDGGGVNEKLWLAAYINLKLVCVVGIIYCYFKPWTLIQYWRL